MPLIVDTTAPRSQRFIDMSGLQYGRLRVTGIAGRDRNKKLFWECACDCGAACVVQGSKLVSGHTQSCGCLHADERKSRAIHGKWRSPEYHTWGDIKQRCHNPACKDYAAYGGRGITVCQEWRESFDVFFADMGPRPSDSHSIDRINNDGHYEPSNCRWATAAQQNRNHRRNRNLTVDGVTLCIADWARRTGLATTTITDRLHRGATPAEAVTK